MKALARDSGFTLIELLIVVAIVLIVGVVVVTHIQAYSASTNGEIGKNAELQALAWAKSLGHQVTGASCVSVDSDGDGYVSCTIRVEDEVTGGMMIPLECADVVTWRVPQPHGCKQIVPFAPLPEKAVRGQ